MSNGLKEIEYSGKNENNMEDLQGQNININTDKENNLKVSRVEGKLSIEVPSESQNDRKDYKDNSESKKTSLEEIIDDPVYFATF